ncbi:hypothetical protein J3A83DRAFT_4428962 [Scleroderma citrinum]
MNPQPHTPTSGESATLDVLQAYDSTTSSRKSMTSDVHHVSGTSNTSPTSPSRSDFRLSAISCASTSNLITPEHGIPRSQAGNRPFMQWNHPSLSDLPNNPPHQPEEDPERISNSKMSKTSIWHGWKVIVCGSWLNILLFLIPVSFVLSSTMGSHHNLTFIFSILSMIPLVKLHDLATRELAIRIGGARTGLLNASMSNTVELVIAITALRKCELRIVQSSLIGSILSKILLILGMCFFAGGLKFSEQLFDQTATQIHTSLLNISVGVLLLPAVYHFVLDDADGQSSLAEQRKLILKMSRGVSIILMFIYISYLIFQFWSHTHLYKDIKQKSDRHPVKLAITSRFLSEKRSTEPCKVSPIDAGDTGDNSQSSIRTSVVSSRVGIIRESPYRRPPFRSGSETTLTNISPPNNEVSMPSNCTVRIVTEARRDDEYNSPNTDDGPTPTRSRWNLSHQGSTITEDTLRTSSLELRTATELPRSDTPDISIKSAETFQEPRLSWLMTLVLLILVTIVVAFNAEELVESMDGISASITKQWIGLILLPAVSSIAECVTAMNVSVRDQLGLSISVAVNSTIQTTLFVIPLMVTLGWIIERPLGLLFDPFESVVLYIAVQTMSYVVADGKSNWLEGIILISLYAIIAVSFWYYPGMALPECLPCTERC